MTKHPDLRSQVIKLMKGAPVGETLRLTSSGSAVDARGVAYEVNQIRKDSGWRYAELRSKEPFVLNMLDRLPYVGDALTSAQCGYLLVLTTYINYDGLLVTNDRNGRPMTRKDMMSALGMRETQRSTLSEFIDACLCYGIMTNENKRYYISKAFHAKGKSQEENIARSMTATLREMASSNKSEHLGFVYKLIPHIHRSSNVLVMNPNEKLYADRIKMSRKDIAKAAGVKPEYVSRITRTMTYNGKSVFAKVTTATDGTFYMLNPQIFKRADRKDYDDTTKEIFGLFDVERPLN